MKVVWSDDAVWALVALEERLARHYSVDKAARIVKSWFAASIGWRIIRSSDAWCPNTGNGSCASSSISGTAYSTGYARMPLKS